MTFNRDSSCYRAAPRSLQTSKFGSYAELSVIPTRRRGIGSVICYAAVAVSAVLIALVLSGCDEAPQNVTACPGPSAGPPHALFARASLR
ncbi:hypothetical protein [Ralstonia phage RPZH3]|nr:hypothetical protein [Ralstonia phage RPZH3]